MHFVVDLFTSEMLLEFCNLRFFLEKFYFTFKLELNGIEILKEKDITNLNLFFGSLQMCDYIISKVSTPL